MSCSNFFNPLRRNAKIVISQRLHAIHKKRRKFKNDIFRKRNFDDLDLSLTLWKNALNWLKDGSNCSVAEASIMMMTDRSLNDEKNFSGQNSNEI